MVVNVIATNSIRTSLVGLAKVLPNDHHGFSNHILLSKCYGSIAKEALDSLVYN